MRFRLKRVALALGALSTIAIQPALAQTPPPASAGTIRVDVTGTNIRRVDTETQSPVIVLTADDLVKSGYTTVAEVLRDITANGQGLLSQGFQGAFAAGASGVALRGLSLGATLVLVDGLRMVAYPLSDDGQRNFVDTSSIPFTAIERIEVLLDGASAIYGSDAIGGVVNFILKKNHTGWQFTAEGGAPFASGGGTNYHASVTTGFGDTSSTFSGFFTGEYRKQESISFQSREGKDWARTNWSNYGGNDLRPGAYTPVTITNPLVQTPILQRPGSSANDPTGFAFLDSRCNFAMRQANQCVYTNDWDTVVPETENINLVGRLAWRFSPDWVASLTGSWFDSKGEQNRRPFAVPAGSAAANVTGGPGIIPTLVNAIPVFTVPATYPGNTLGVAAIVRGLVPDVPNQNRQVETQTTRIVADISGSFMNWDARLSAGYQLAESKIDNNGYVNYNALYAALNNPSNPLLLTGGNPASVVSTYGASVPQTDKNEYDFIQATVTRDLMKLDGGMLGLALGASYYYQKLNADNSAPCKDGSVAGLNCFYAVGDQANTALYGEINAPVFKSLELNAAIRWDDYDTGFSEWTPKFGAKWTPIKEVAVRGTWGKGFRAPNIMESGDAGLAYSAAGYRDPLNCPVSLPNGQPDLTSSRNVTNQNGNNLCSYNVTYLQTTNPALSPEKSTNWTLGLILEPIPNWSTTFDYYEIDLKNQIVTGSSLSSFNPEPIRGEQQIVTFGDGSQGISPVGVVAYLPDRYVNAQATKTTGLDLQSTWNFNMPWAWDSRGKLGVQWSHIFTYDITFEGVTYNVAGTHGPAVVSGNTGMPRDRVQLTGQWSRGPFTGTLIGNYVSSLSMDDPSSGNLTCDQMASYGNASRWPAGGVPGEFCKVDSFWYWNLNLQWQFNPQTMVQLSIQNLFDQQAPVDVGTYGGSSGANRNSTRGTPYNPSLHMPGVIGASWLLGVSYKF